MANTLTIKRYNGSDWEELYPKTTIAQVVDLANTLAGKEATSNKVTTIAPANTDTQYPSAKAVYTAISNVSAIANGKTASYVLSYATDGNSAFNSTADTLTLSDDFTDIEGHFIELHYLHIGDVIYVTETNVPDRWVGALNDENVVLYKMETTKVPIENYSLKSDTIKDVKYESNKLQKIVNGGSSYSDIMNLSLDNTTGAITIGSVSKTPIYSHQTMKYRKIQVAGSDKIGDTSNTALNFKNTDSVNFGYDNGLYAYSVTQTVPTGSPVENEIAFIIPAPTTA